MAKSNYTELSNQLSELLRTSPRSSESQNAITSGKALELVRSSSLSEDEQEAVLNAISNSANPTGYYYDNNGIQAGIEALESLEPQVEPVRFNIKNLQNLVSNGAIFSVEFIKRSNGELRKMVCRLGVKKHLRGGAKAYDAKQHNLLTVFDMEKEGYRSIPVDSIQRLSVNGQAFTFSS